MRNTPSAAPRSRRDRRCRHLYLHAVTWGRYYRRSSATPDVRAAVPALSPEVTTVIIAGESHYPLIEASHLDAVAAIDGWLDARAGRAGVP